MKKELEMIDEVIIKPEWIKDAEVKSKSLGVLNNSISKGQGNVLGFVGEFAALSLLKEGHMSNTYDYAIQTPTSTIDVKTKRC